MSAPGRSADGGAEGGVVDLGAERARRAARASYAGGVDQIRARMPDPEAVADARKWAARIRRQQGWPDPDREAPQ